MLEFSMVDLQFLEIKFKKPGVTPEIADLLKKPPKKKRDDQKDKFWTLKERLIVGAILAGTMLGSLYFWYLGNGGNLKIPTNFEMPSFNFGGFGVNETIVVE